MSKPTFLGATLARFLSLPIRSFFVIPVFAAALALACADDAPLVGPVEDPLFDISDGANGGAVSGFFWLTPTVKRSQKNFTGTFDPNLLSINPTIQICKIAGDGPDGLPQG